MSDRDPEVRKLAEEITQEIYGAGASLEVVNSITDGEAARTLARWESRLAQREAEVAKILGAAIVAGTLRPGERMADPPEHAAVRAILNVVAERDDLQVQRDRAERDSQRLRERNLILEDEVAALQAQLHRALGELAGLRGALEDLASKLDGWSDEITDRVQREGPDLSPAALQRWEGISEGYLKSARRIRSALTASPLSERAGAVIGAGLAAFEAGFVDEQETFDRFFDALIALRAELAKGGADA